MYVPIGKKVTYARFCCDVRIQNDDINQTRLTVGGDRLPNDGKNKHRDSWTENDKDTPQQYNINKRRKICSSRHREFLNKIET